MSEVQFRGAGEERANGPQSVHFRRRSRQLTVFELIGHG